MQPLASQVWDDWVQAVDQGNSAAEWLGTVLQMPKLRLVAGLRSHKLRCFICGGSTKWLVDYGWLTVMT